MLNVKKSTLSDSRERVFGQKTHSYFRLIFQYRVPEIELLSQSM